MQMRLIYYINIHFIDVFDINLMNNTLQQNGGWILYYEYNLHTFVACNFYFYFQLPKITTRLISHRFPRLFRSSRNSRKRGERDCIRQIWWASLHSKITLCRIRKLRSGMKSLPRDSFHETRDAASYPGNIYFYPSRNHWLLLPWNSYYTGAIKHTLVKRISYVERTTRSPCVIKKSINLDRMQKLN